MSDKEWKGVGVALGCLSIPVVLLIATIWGGWVLSVVWNWFMPQIFGLPELTLIQAIAVSLVIGWLTKATVPAKEGQDAWEALFAAYGVAALTPLMVLVFAWVIRGFM